jgi:hypothetical protein
MSSYPINLITKMIILVQLNNKVRWRESEGISTLGPQTKVSRIGVSSYCTFLEPLTSKWCDWFVERNLVERALVLTEYDKDCRCRVRPVLRMKNTLAAHTTVATER